MLTKTLTLFIEVLQKIQPLSPALEEAILQSFEEVSFKKNELILKVGETCNAMWFLANGLAKSCVDYEDNNPPTTTRLMRPGHIIVSVLSYYRDMITNESITTLTDCTLYKITKAKRDKLLQIFPGFNVHVRILTEQYLCQVAAREEMLRFPTAAMRYAYFMKHHDYFLQHISIEQSASFAKMSRSTFLHERKKANQKK